jgi:hypothetical protein
MGSKKHKKSHARQVNRSARLAPVAKSPRGLIVFLVTLASVAIVFTIYTTNDTQSANSPAGVNATARTSAGLQTSISRGATQQQSTTGDNRGPVASRAPVNGLPPLPLVRFPAARPPEVIRSVYEFAANNPEVLNYVPCFCGCENFGHVSSHDCFVDHRNQDGQVATWEAHGMG